MKRFNVIIKGEMSRLKKYYVIQAGFVVSLLWIVALYFADMEAMLPAFLPSILLMDSFMMPVLVVGVMIFYEKQEGTAKSMFVSPVSKKELIIGKVISAIVVNTMTLIFILIYIAIFNRWSDFEALNVIVLVLATVLSITFGSLLGFIAIIFAKDFTGLLMFVIKITFLLGIPVILYHVGIIKATWYAIAIKVLPTEAIMLALQSGIQKLETWEIIYAWTYLILGIAMLSFIVSKQVDRYKGGLT